MAPQDGSRREQPVVHVVVTCTNRKKRPVSPDLHVRSVAGRNALIRARSWIGRLEASDAVAVPASDLYSGEHWTVARAIPVQAPPGWAVRLWICSAGYGLIPVDALIRPYGATFSPGHADTVPGDDGGRSWWRALGEWPGPGTGGPRSLAALANAEPEAALVLALSEPYVRACRDDILSASDTLGTRLVVVSAGSRGKTALDDVMVPLGARLQSCLGGTRQSLNARIAAHLICRGIGDRAEAAVHLAQLQAAQPPITRYDRKKLSDQEVFGLIADAVVRCPDISASRLLRELRDDGYACEQQRFGSLFQAFKEARS